MAVLADHLFARRVGRPGFCAHLGEQVGQRRAFAFVVIGKAPGAVRIAFAVGDLDQVVRPAAGFDQHLDMGELARVEIGRVDLAGAAVFALHLHAVAIVDQHDLQRAQAIVGARLPILARAGFGGPGARAAGFAIGFGHPVLKLPHGQAFVEGPALGDLLAIMHDGDGDAVDRAIERGIGEDVRAIVERGGPGIAELGGLGMEAELVGAFLGHVDGRGRAGDGAGARERLDKAALPLGRPAVMALRLAGHGGEIEPGLELGELARAEIAGGAAAVADDGGAVFHGR